MDLFNLKQASILVVDDEPINIQLVHQLLSSEYDIFMATSGSDAVKICRQERPDLVLLDVNMPDISGLEVCRQLKADSDTYDIPVIFITSFTDTQSEIDCWEAGALDFVRKPINQLTLINRVKSHLTLKFQSDILKKHAYSDGLTSIPNRRYFDENCHDFWQRCEKSNQGISLILFDIDYFKLYNDHYGHLAGDDCLRSIAQLLDNEVTTTSKGFVARYGGEEFVAVIPNLRCSQVEKLIQLIYKKVLELNIEHVTSLLNSKQVTLSAGAAFCHFPSSKTLEEALEITDVQLYQAKENGRNCFVITDINK